MPAYNVSIEPGANDSRILKVITVAVTPSGGRMSIMSTVLAPRCGAPFIKLLQPEHTADAVLAAAVARLAEVGR